MNAAQRLLDAPTITADLLVEVLQVRPSFAIGVIAALVLGGALYEVSACEFILTPSGRAAVERDAARCREVTS